ncbi:MAG: hypothetical protein L6R28_08185 [Planctomycetes bacterium]|nr:hypothetical protein [Planctomycetota bacterium]
MNASVAMMNGVDADPTDALQRAKDARRIQSAGRWYLLLIGLGIVETLFGLVVAIGPDLFESAPPLLPEPLFPVCIFAFSFLVQHLFRKSRESAIARGEPKMTLPNAPGWATVTAITVFGALFTVLGILAWSGSPWIEKQGALPVAVAQLVIAIAFGWNGWRLRLWEYVLAGAGSISVATFCLLPDFAGLGDKALPMLGFAVAIPYLIAGIFLRRRWRAFVATLPKEGDA